METTASYNVKFARLYGINCAILIAKIAFLQAHTTRSDGFCWRSQQELWDETGLTPKMQRSAIKTLVDEGFLITKNTMIIGTAVKCRHYRLTDSYYQNWKTDEPDCDQKAQPIVTNGNNRMLPNGTTESDQKAQSVNSNQHNNQLSNTKENTKRKSDDDELFAEFWKAYPKKVGKETARRAFSRLKAKEKNVDMLIQAINIQKQSRQWRDPQYIPYPATWLNGKRWQDVLSETTGTITTGTIQYEHDANDLPF